MNSKTETDVMQINFGWLSEYSADGRGYYDLEKVSDVIDLSVYSEVFRQGYYALSGVY